LRLLIYEYLCSEYAEQDIESNILCEGYAMLKALISDFKMLGHYIITFLSSRMVRFNPPLQADEIISLASRGDAQRKLKEVCQKVDAAYIIAPESNGMLGKLVRDVEEFGGIAINCSPESIEESSNKLNVYEKLRRVGINVPETVPVDVKEDVKRVRSIAKDFGFPLIFKPVMGAGASGLSIVRNEGEIDMAIKKVKREASKDFFLVQRFVKGTPASVSVISDGENALPLTLNAQLVRLAPPGLNSSYEGGFVPLHHPQWSEAFKAAKFTVECFRGLRGYVGVDMILTENAPVIIEVNPRLTTSYVGLREALNFNIAGAILNSVLKSELPRDMKTLRCAFFSKVSVKNPKVEVLKHTYTLNGVLTPPLPLAEDESYALIVSSSHDLMSARLKAYQVKRKLIEILSEAYN
jgi:predicted ATP-grasp superfamily ATP-dependent carboligase